MVVGRRIRWLGGMRRCAHLDERQRRLLLGAEASERGGITLVAEATGADADTVSRGVREIEGVSELSGRVRAPGGGRKKLTETDPAGADNYVRPGHSGLATKTGSCAGWCCPGRTYR
jgi:hypothetical protein